MRNNTEYHVIKISYIGGHKVNLHKDHRENELFLSVFICVICGE